MVVKQWEVKGTSVAGKLQLPVVGHRWKGPRSRAPSQLRTDHRRRGVCDHPGRSLRATWTEAREDVDFVHVIDHEEKLENYHAQPSSIIKPS